MSEHDGRSAGPPGEHGALLARLHMTEAAAEQIGTGLDESATCRELAGFLFRNLCDAVAVDLRAEDGRLHRVAAAGAAGLLEAPAGAPPSVRALDGGHPLSEWTVLCAGTPVHLLSVPLQARNQVHGAVLAVRAHGRFSDHEAATVHFAARLAAVHLGHARELAATEETAMHLQRALVSEPGRPHPNLERASRYL
ncbi:protein phosphatase, partial [Streptomyces sp. NPDC059456]